MADRAIPLGTRVGLQELETDPRFAGGGVRASHGRRRGGRALPPPNPSVPSAFEQPATWDTVTIGGVLFLGLAQVKGATGNALDVKHHRGRDGGRITDGGAVAAEFQIVFRYWDRETEASWDQVFHAIDPQRPAESREPLDVSHPALARRRITKVYVKKVAFEERQPSGEWHVTADVIQWLPSMTDRRGRSVTRTSTRANGSAIAVEDTAFDGLNTPDPTETDTGP